MTVLKGAAAAALYGSDASNGAIIITTKKGQAGKGKISYSNQFRWDKSYGFEDLLQNKYANGYYGTTNWYYQTRYGAEYPDDMPVFDNLAAIFQTGYTGRHSLSAEYGTEKVTLRGSASSIDQKGTVRTTGYTRLNLSLSGTAQVNKWLKLESSMMYTGSTNDKVNTGTESPFYRAVYWPIVSDASEYMDTDGKHMAYPDYYLDKDLLNPFFALYKNKFYDESDRMLTTMAATLTPIKNTFLRVQMGWDVGMQTFVTSRHPYFSTNQTGAGYYNLTKSNFSDPTLNVIAGYSNTILNDNLSLTAQFGYHQQENGVARLATTGSKFLDVDFQSISNCDALSISSISRNTKRRIQALSGQIELGYQNMAYLTFRGRNDWSSTLPVGANRFFYPAVEASFIVSELPFMKNVKQIDYIKLRGTIAQVGKDAGPLEIDPQLVVTALWGGGYRYDYTGPNPDLVPEMNTTKEIGFEGRFLKNRLNADFTYFWTNCKDQIVKGFRMSYGTGFVLNTMNVGDFKTWGFEGHIDGDILNMSNGLRLNVGFNASHTSSEITYLPPNLSEYYNAYTWNSGNIRNGIQVGQPITSLTGTAFQRNNNGDLLIDQTTGLPLVSSTWSVIGDREPKLRFGITTALSYKNLRFSAMFAGRYKATVVNATKRTMMQQGYSWESVDARESGPVVFNGVLRDGNENTADPTPNTMSVSYDLYSTIYSGGDENWVEKNVNYLRLQEIRLSYNLPNKWLVKTPLSQASIFAAGNDLFILTNYSGIDAVGNTVSAAAGGTGGEGMDVWSLPMPRGYSIGINVTFK
jgi:TonB-linked SusC/RagA family outer membrane protein